MITRLNVTSIYVLDKDEALDFYVNKLGLEKGNDARQGDYRWLIATSSRKAQVAASVGALRLVREPQIVDGSRVEHAKPAPDLLLLAAATLGLPPERCWAIGDSTWDVRAAVAAGMAAVGVTAGSAVDVGALEAAGAARVVPTLSELASLLRDLAG